MKNDFLGLPMEMLMPREPMWSTPIPSLKTDIIEHEDSFEIIMDLPGFSKEDVKITTNNDTLLIAVQKEIKKDEEEKNYILKERSSTSMARRFQIRDLSPNKIKASFKDGILQVFVEKPKKEEPQIINID